jgi:oligopeptidase B
VISVTAHVRGGGELGRSWHENGKHLNKLNSINDFVDVAEWLIRNGWTTQDYLACEGRSAGALLVASAVNQRPDIFRASLLGVPFLDPINSMSDHSLPLTTTEYGEYGDPHQQVDLEYLMQYSPLHNMKVDRLYPSTLLVGGLLDSRVVFTDMVKYAAEFRLASSARNMQTAPLVCVKIDMASGHSFGSDINKYCAELGFMYAFLLDQILMECQQMD